MTSLAHDIRHKLPSVEEYVRNGGRIERLPTCTPSKQVRSEGWQWSKRHDAPDRPHERSR